MPFPDMEASLSCLDNKRLGKQRVETYQILRTLLGESQGWANHPAVKMWSGYESALALYGYISCSIWLDKGFKDSLMPKFVDYIVDLSSCVNQKTCSIDEPWWISNAELNKSHQSNLLRKDPVHYGQWFKSVRDDLPYLWPSSLTGDFKVGKIPNKLLGV